MLLKTVTSKQKGSHFPDHLMRHVVYWFKSQAIFCVKEKLIWIVNCRPPCWRNQEIYSVPAEEDGVLKFSLGQHFLWYNEWLFSMYTLSTLLNSSSGCSSLQTCISSVADRLFSLWKITFFFSAQTSCYCKFLKAVVRWPEEPDQTVNHNKDIAFVMVFSADLTCKKIIRSSCPQAVGCEGE